MKDYHSNQALFAHSGYAEISKIGTHESIYEGKMYSALIEK
jgi:hypothetical protein